MTDISFVCNVQETILCFGGGSNTSTTKSDPWSGQQGYLTDVMGQAQNQYNNYNPQSFYAATGNTGVADMNSQEKQAISSIGNTGLNGTSSFNAANDAMTRQLSGDPAYTQSIAASVVPGLESQFAQGNSMNNPAAAYSVGNGLGNAILQNQQGAANTANTLYNSQLGGQNAALTAGQATQQQDQNVLDAIQQAFNYQQQLPYQKLNQYSNLVNGQYGSTQTTNSPNSSIFSDRRLKEDIVPVAVDANGLTIYKFRYKNTAITMLGYMADEVAKVFPEAVSCDESGFDKVNYALVGGLNV